MPRYAPEASPPRPPRSSSRTKPWQQRDLPPRPFTRRRRQRSRAGSGAGRLPNTRPRVRSDAEAAVSAANAALMQLEARVKAPRLHRCRARDASSRRATAIKDAEKDLQKARSLLAAENYSAARDTSRRSARRFAQKSRMVEAAITLRTVRRPAEALTPVAKDAPRTGEAMAEFSAGSHAARLRAAGASTRPPLALAKAEAERGTASRATAMGSGWRSHPVKLRAPSRTPTRQRRSR